MTATACYKLAPRSTACVFLGYPSSHKGYCCLDLSTRRIIISHHVVFDETCFPFGLYSTRSLPSDLDFLLAGTTAPAPSTVPEQPHRAQAVLEELLDDPAILFRGPVLPAREPAAAAPPQAAAAPAQPAAAAAPAPAVAPAPARDFHLQYSRRPRPPATAPAPPQPEQQARTLVLSAPTPPVVPPAPSSSTQAPSRMVTRS